MNPGLESRRHEIRQILDFFKGRLPEIVRQIDLRQISREVSEIDRRRGEVVASRRNLCSIRHLQKDEATVSVREEDELIAYELLFILVPDVGVVGSCACDNRDLATCHHVVAGAIVLQELREAAHLDGNEVDPPADWRRELAELISPRNLPRPAQKVREKEWVLFFSMTPTYGGFEVWPWLAEASAIPEGLWQDREALQRYIHEATLRKELRRHLHEVRSGDIWKLRLVNETPLSRSMMRLALDQINASRVSRSNSNQAYFWEGLANELVFHGRYGVPIEKPLRVIAGLTPTTMEIEQGDNGLRLSPVAVLPEMRISLINDLLTVFAEQPLWLCFNSFLFRSDLTLERLRNLQQAREVVVPPASIPEFYDQHLAEIVEALPVRNDSLQFEQVPETPPVPRLYLTETDQELGIALRFGYGPGEVPGQRKPPVQSFSYDEKTGRSLQITRQPEAELRWRAVLDNPETGLKAVAPRQARPGRKSSHEFLLRKGVHPYDFLTNRLPRLLEAGFEVFGEAELSSRVNRAKPSISFQISSEIDWFDLQGVVEWGDQKVSLGELRRAIRRNEKFIKLADGTIGEIPTAWLDKYKHLFGLSEASENGCQVSPHHLALLDDLFDEEVQIKTDRRFEAARSWLRNFNGIPAQDVPAGFQGELRPYQKAGFDWLHFLRESGFGGCLADDMGTGKTIQALAFLLSLREGWQERNRRKRKKEPPLVNLLVVPRSLVINWMREAERFAPNLRILDFAHGERSIEIAKFDQYDLVITTYGILIREIERLHGYQFDTVILDEAQAIKNPVSESAKAVRALTCRHRLTLTGTPVENNTLELWSQFAFLNPGLLGSAEYFREQFLGPIERESDEASTQTLKRLVYPFILRRTKDQVINDLPPRTEKILWGEMEPAQRALYNETRDQYRALLLNLIEEKGVVQARFRVLEGLLRLRQICNHPRLVKPSHTGGSAKMEALLETISNAITKGHKTLVFSQFVQMLKLIEKELKRRHIPYAYLDGSTTNRQERVDRFQQDAKIQVFLISLKAGGVGLNLTAADYVIHVDPWWNPAVEMQATDRAHRIGQERPVFIYKLLTKDSVEEKILQLQERKRSLVTQLITTESGFFKSLTADDINGLFS